MNNGLVANLSDLLTVKIISEALNGVGDVVLLMLLGL